MEKPPSRGEVTELLIDCRNGNSQAADHLLRLVYHDLRRIAARALRGERPGHTLQPTALVNELYLKLFAGEIVDWKNRAHFFAVAAQQLRRILIDHARGVQARKRGAGQPRLSLLENDMPAGQADVDEILDLSEALTELESLDPRSAQTIELRFFGGLTAEEAAEVMGISLATLKRDWEFARAWLYSRLTKQEGSN